ncbi:hypothetical protein [Spiroplasma endosymbiont of Notiophilus biguttatus]|uniref:hypothetical protein n=1 Tax=Spiroplasma endosymbiont of Notiophilus biguttatus TaxID=3066285 RepID=UPI00313C9E23
MFLSLKLVDVFKRALEYLKVEYEDKETFHSKWRKNKVYILYGTRTRKINNIFGVYTSIGKNINIVSLPF